MKQRLWLFTIALTQSASALEENTVQLLPHTSPDSLRQVTSGELKSLLVKGLQALESTQREQWSYRISRYENEEGTLTSSVEDFVPHENPAKQWTLTLLDGKPPTEKQQADFAKSKADPDAQNAFKLRDIILLDDVALQSENQAFIEAVFPVHIERLGDKASQALRGTLIYNKPQQFIQSVEILNQAPFSPLFGAKITDMKLTFSFRRIDCAILPHRQTLDMTGRFAFFTEIDEVSEDTYSDYHYTPLTDIPCPSENR